MSRIYRFFLRDPNIFINEANPPDEFMLNSMVEPEIFFQLTKVLRVREKDEVIFLNPRSSSEFSINEQKTIKIPEFKFTVASLSKKELILSFQKILYNTNESFQKLELALCLPNKPGKLDFILEKAIELGVKKIYLIKSDYSNFSHELKIQRLQKIIFEASEQSERGFLPELEIVNDFKFFLQSKKAYLQVALERISQTNQITEAPGNKNLLIEEYNKIPSDQPIILVIGPEGGFSEDEKNLIEKLEITCFSLGKRILRMETAAILALGIVSLKLE